LTGRVNGIGLDWRLVWGEATRERRSASAPREIELLAELTVRESPREREQGQPHLIAQGFGVQKGRGGGVKSLH